MKNISPALAAHIAGEVTTLATCWKLTRRDGATLGFTDHDRDITFETVTYRAATGFTPSAVANSAGFAVDNLEVEGMLSASSITEADIMAGLYDFAEIEIFMVNYADVSQGKMILRRGWLGEVSMNNQQFTAEVRGLTQALSQNIGELFSPSCRATLGDARCSVNLASVTVSGTISTTTSRQDFTANSVTGAAGLYTLGKITFTSGANSGLAMEVKEHVKMTTGGARITLVLPMPYAIANGDGFNLTQGCDKTLATCKTRYDNVLNFRGEPHVPGIDRMLETAGTRSSW